MLKTELEKRIDHISFHTPGHSGGVSVSDGTRSGMSFDCRFDVTELSFTDNLLEPAGVLKELEQSVAAAYGADEAFLFTNGATGAVFAAVQAISGKIAVVGSAHVSVYRALSLFRKRGVFLRDFESLAEYCSDAEAGKTEQLAAIFVTSPDYKGYTVDLEQFRTAANRAGAAFIVDASHGSHFAFSTKLPIPATEYGDLVIYSLHKTLPVLTGGAVLAVKTEFADRAFDARRLTHTTSPSYPVLLSVETAMEKLKHGEEDYEEVLSTIAMFRKDLENTPFRIAENDDPTRVVLLCAGRGAELYSALEMKGIYAEYYEDDAVIFIVTPYNKQYLAYLAETLKSCGFRRTANAATDFRGSGRGDADNCRANRTNEAYGANGTDETDGEHGTNGTRSEDSADGTQTSNPNKRSGDDQTGDSKRSDAAGDFSAGRKRTVENRKLPTMPKRKELFPCSEHCETVPFETAEGRILNSPIGLYPPGVPLFFAGDVLDKNAVEFIEKNRSRMFGLARKGVSVVK